ncbi:MAG: alpha/beta hydrolase [Bacteroidetes bacterium]|nr:MAG: alpha/beta hydrolase [Bacteroidota bacterium]
MTKTIFLLLCGCLLGVHFLYGQEKVIPLWPEGIPCENGLTEEVEQNPRGRFIRKVHEPSITVFLPGAGQANGSSVLICPGGGYTLLAWDWEGTEMAKWFNSFGVAAFVLKYRLPHWESEACRDKVALMDAARAMRLLRSRAAQWQLDPDRMGIMGFSAGGHLASTLITHFDAGQPEATLEVERFSSRPDFAILMYPVITMKEAYTHRGSRNNLIGNNPSEDAVNHFSNEEHVSPQTPPTILIHANDDKGVVPENSLLFYQALRRHGVPAALHIYEQGGHGFSFARDKGAVKGWPEVCRAWMKERGLLK